MPSPFLPRHHVGILFRFEGLDLLPLPQQTSTEHTMYEGRQDAIKGRERRIGDREAGNARRRHTLSILKRFTLSLQDSPLWLAPFTEVNASDRTAGVYLEELNENANFVNRGLAAAAGKKKESSSP